MQGPAFFGFSFANMCPGQGVHDLNRLNRKILAWGLGVLRALWFRGM